MSVTVLCVTVLLGILCVMCYRVTGDSMSILRLGFVSLFLLVFILPVLQPSYSGQGYLNGFSTFQHIRQMLTSDRAESNHDVLEVIGRQLVFR